MQLIKWKVSSEQFSSPIDLCDLRCTYVCIGTKVGGFTCRIYTNMYVYIHSASGSWSPMASAMFSHVLSFKYLNALLAAAALTTPEVLHVLLCVKPESNLLQLQLIITLALNFRQGRIQGNLFKRSDCKNNQKQIVSIIDYCSEY